VSRDQSFDVSDLPDAALFAHATEARSRMRRFACYGLLLYVPVGALPFVYTATLSDAQRTFLLVMATLTVTLAVATLAISQRPRLAPRLVLVALVPLLPVIGIAVFHARKTPGAQSPIETVNLFRTLPLFDEVAVRLDRDPDGPEQRAWLGFGPRF